MDNDELNQDALDMFDEFEQLDEEDYESETIESEYTEEPCLLLSSPQNLEQIFKNLLYLNSSCHFNQKTKTYSFKSSYSFDKKVFEQIYLINSKPFLLDLKNRTHTYQYQFDSIMSEEYYNLSIGELLPFSAPTFQDDKASIIHFVHLLNHNFEVLERALECYPEYTVELLDVSMQVKNYHNAFKSLRNILNKTLKAYPHLIDSTKKALTNHLKKAEFEKTDKIEASLIDLYKHLFGVAHMDEFLEDLGFKQEKEEKVLLSQPLSILLLNKKRMSMTYLSLSIFDIMNELICERKMNFPKCYLTQENRESYFVGVESQYPHHIEKIQQFIQTVSTYKQPELEENEGELVANIMLKINLEFEMNQTDKVKVNKI